MVPFLLSEAPKGFIITRSVSNFYEAPKFAVTDTQILFSRVYQMAQIYLALNMVRSGQVLDFYEISFSG